MKYRHWLMILALAALTACSSSHRPTYSGHEESTEGVPGFVNGKKVSPHVKLGQSYTVDGETYVPRMQPDYVEEGLASWYGPGFHGGKTANGERFDSGELTAAHRTLPLPSIVRVTLLSTGKQVVVRVNDRGPFAHSRILDMSRGAAEKIGLLRAGVAKVRVEYLKNESEKFADLLAQGRDPKSIDLESEILNAPDAPRPREYASNAEPQAVKDTPKPDDGFWGSLGATAANASEPPPAPAARVVRDDVGVSDGQSAPFAPVAASDLQAPAPAKSAPVASPSESPFAKLDVADAGAPAAPPAAPPQAPPERVPPPVPASGNSVYVQIGAFQNRANAEKLLAQHANIEGLHIYQKVNANGVTLFHVRAGPFVSSQASNKTYQQLQSAGAEARITKD